MSEDGIKVTDRRMFTEDGELREEYRAQYQDASEEPSSGVGGEPARSEEGPEAPPPVSVAEGGAPSEPRPSFESESGARDLGFMDLVALLAEPIPLFLGDAKLPGEQSAEDLDRARLQIDLLQVLREKVKGNISHDEDAVLADLIYQLRMRYVQKRR